MFSSILARMPANRDKILFSVRGDRFPAELWQAFRAACDQKQEKWIDVLRRLVEQYVSQESKP